MHREDRCTETAEGKTERRNESRFIRQRNLERPRRGVPIHHVAKLPAVRGIRVCANEGHYIECKCNQYTLHAGYVEAT